MKQVVMRAIAMPPTLFFVPYKLTVLNIALFAVVFVVGTGIMKINPLLPFGLLATGHVVLLSMATREPHIEGMIEAWISRRKTRNLLPVKGNKYLP